jgi:hypothetical protein
LSLRALSQITLRDPAGSAFIVYENSHTVVFLDMHPNNAGHVLVVPKQHVESFYESDENSLLGGLFEPLIGTAIFFAFRSDALGGRILR